MRRFLALPMVLACLCVLSGCGAQKAAAPIASGGGADLLPLVMPFILKTASAAQAGPGGQPGTGRPPATYTVKTGDMLSSIAKRFGVSVTELVQANHLANPDALSVGQRLVIPGQFADAEAVADAPVAPIPRPAAVRLRQSSRRSGGRRGERGANCPSRAVGDRRRAPLSL